MTTAANPPVPRVFLKPGQDRRLARGCPWAFSNELRMDADAKAIASGSLVTLHRVDGKTYGIGTFNPHALIAFRLLADEGEAPMDGGFFERRFHRALALRDRLFGRPFYRMVHAEADGVAGLVVDRYGDAVVVQANTAGMEALLPAVLDGLARVLAPRLVVLRGDSGARRLEGLEREVRIAVGTVDAPVTVEENGLVYFADLLAGQKTGWFYDQRRSRAFVASLATGTRILDVFCHSGGFAIAALGAGAEHAVAIDSSEAALALAGRSAAANGVVGKLTVRRGEAYGELERLAAAGDRFGVVVCDPPAFVKSRKDMASGLKGYRKLARLGAALVEPGGFLFIASCSHNVDRTAFALEVGRGIDAAGRRERILREAGAAADHPVHPQLPESAYLKSLVVQLD
ncbi:MAG: class I SAM-dependent rRNA methyltransferase [Rhodospirillales bacterium]